MKVAATMTISLMQDKELWGMIVCHHASPRQHCFEVRACCDVVWQLVSLPFRKVPEAEQLHENLGRF
jgi:light-regulated signal transduction histidine kinase (bacteriophytochrome)